MYSARLLNQIINVLVAMVEFFLGLRLILKLLGANPAADFVAWVYATSAPLLEPFRGMFPSPVIERGFVLEFSTLFAMVIYMLAGWLAMEMIALIGMSVTGRQDRVNKGRRGERE